MERLTKQKQLIYKMLKECHLHPTLLELAELVREKDSSIGQATVYRTINKLVEKGEVAKLVSIDHNYRYDVSKDHYHFQCTNCGIIEDIFYSSDELKKVEELFKNQNINSIDLIGYGLCKKCSGMIVKRKKV